MPTKSSSPQRDSRLYAVKAAAEAEILMLEAEINILLDHPVGVAGHPHPLTNVSSMIESVSVQQGIIDQIEARFAIK